MCIEILVWFVVFVEYQSCLFWLLLSVVVHALKVVVKMAVSMRINSVSYWFLLSINTPSRRSSSVAARRRLRSLRQNLSEIGEKMAQVRNWFWRMYYLIHMDSGISLLAFGFGLHDKILKIRSLWPWNSHHFGFTLSPSASVWYRFFKWIDK